MIGPKKGEEILGMSSDRTRFSSSEAQMYCDSKDKEALVENYRGMRVCGILSKNCWLSWKPVGETDR
jgi:hypothetical protein